jgi:hypothetical protein
MNICIYILRCDFNYVPHNWKVNPRNSEGIFNPLYAVVTSYCEQVVLEVSAYMSVVYFVNFSY